MSSVFTFKLCHICDNSAQIPPNIYFDRATISINHFHFVIFIIFCRKSTLTLFQKASKNSIRLKLFWILIVNSNAQFLDSFSYYNRKRSLKTSYRVPRICWGVFNYLLNSIDLLLRKAVLTSKTNRNDFTKIQKKMNSFRNRRLALLFVEDHCVENFEGGWRSSIFHVYKNFLAIFLIFLALYQNLNILLTE